MNVLYCAQYIMGTGKPHSGAVFDVLVNLLQMVRGFTADFQKKIEFTGKIVAGNDVGMRIYLVNKILIVAGMLHADLH